MSVAEKPPFPGRISASGVGLWQAGALSAALAGVRKVRVSRGRRLRALARLGGMIYHLVICYLAIENGHL